MQRSECHLLKTFFSSYSNLCFWPVHCKPANRIGLLYCAPDKTDAAFALELC